MSPDEALRFLSQPGRRLLLMLRQHIGDVVNSTAAIHTVRQGCPQAFIGVSVGERAVEVLRNSPDIDQLIVRPWSRDLWSKRRYVASLHKGRFEAALILDEVGSQARNARMAGIGFRAGITEQGAPKNLSVWTPFLTDAHDTRDQNAALLSRLGFDASDDRPRLFTSPQDERIVTELLAGLGQPFVVIHPGTSERTRHWLPERFAAVADGLVHAGLGVVITGSKGETELCESVASACYKQILQLAGRTTVLQFAEVARRAQCVISGDTGPMHVAAAMGTRLVAIFGPTYPNKTGPWGEGHQIIQGRCDCVHRDWKTCTMQCMREVSVEQVIEAVGAFDRQLTRE